MDDGEQCFAATGFPSTREEYENWPWLRHKAFNVAVLQWCAFDSPDATRNTIFTWYMRKMNRCRGRAEEQRLVAELAATLARYRGDDGRMDNSPEFWRALQPPPYGES